MEGDESRASSADDGESFRHRLLLYGCQADDGKIELARLGDEEDYLVSVDEVVCTDVFVEHDVDAGGSGVACGFEIGPVIGGFSSAEFAQHAEEVAFEKVGGEMGEDALVGGEIVVVGFESSADDFAGAGGEMFGEDADVLAEEERAVLQLHAQGRLIREGAGVGPVDAKGETGLGGFVFEKEGAGSVGEHRTQENGHEPLCFANVLVLSAVVGWRHDGGLEYVGGLLGADAEGGLVLAGGDGADSVDQCLGGGGADAGIGIDLDGVGEFSFFRQAVVKETGDARADEGCVGSACGEVGDGGCGGVFSDAIERGGGAEII